MRGAVFFVSAEVPTATWRPPRWAIKPPALPTMPERDAVPLLEEGHALGDDEHVSMLEEDAQYVMSPRPTRYLYAPMSYEQAMTPQRPMWHPLYWYAFAKEHWHIVDSLRPPEHFYSAISRVGTTLRVLWPQNRMHQTILIVIALWIMLSYTSWAVSESLPRRKVDISAKLDYATRLSEELESSILEPRPGDGHEAERPEWRRLRCFSTRRPLRFSDAIACQEHWNFTMPAFPHVDSLTSTDHAYLHINPVINEAQGWYPSKRQEASSDDFANRPSPRAPADIYVVSRDVSESDPLRDKILVDVIATHDKNAWPLLTHAYVAKMSHSLFSEGLAIVTHQRPHGLYSHPNHDPLRFDILVSIPSHQPIAGLSIDMREGNIDVLTETAFANAKRIRHLAYHRPKTLLEWMYQSFKDMELTAAELKAAFRIRDQEHFFGSLTLHTQYGHIYVNGHIRSTSEIIAKVMHGVIDSAAQLYANFIYMTTEKGRISLLERASAHASKLLHLSTSDGSIESKPGSIMYGTKAVVTANNGSVTGPALWHANFSLAMSAPHGHIDAAVAVQKPALVDVPYDDFLRTEQGRRVEAQFAAHGNVSIKYVEQTPGVPLKSTASSEVGHVNVVHDSNYEGKLRVQGAQVHLSSSQMPLGRHLAPVDDHRSESPAWLASHVVWDEQARGPAPKMDPSTPVHLEPGKSPLDYGAESHATSKEGTASIFVT